MEQTDTGVRSRLARYGQRWVERTSGPRHREPEATASGADAGSQPADGAPLLVARGTGGNVALMRDHIVLTKNHLLGDFINIFGLGYGKVQKSIMIDDISSVAIIRPMVFPNFITFTYPGSPSSSGNAFTDALKDNALIMNFLDNRRFYELKAMIHTLHQ
jgi:hypothetical protein